MVLRLIFLRFCGGGKPFYLICTGDPEKLVVERCVSTLARERLASLGIKMIGPLAEYYLNDETMLITDGGIVDEQTMDEFEWIPWGEILEEKFGAISNFPKNRFIHISPFNELPPSQEDLPLVGLTNIGGRTCYLNVILQCLFRIPEFVERLEERVKETGFDLDEISGALLEVFDFMAAGETPPSESLLNLVLTINMHHGDLVGRRRLCMADSIEVLRLMLDTLETELHAGVNPLLPGAFDDLFKIVITRRVVSTTETRLEPADAPVLSIQTIPDNSKVPLDLYDLIRSSLAKETLSPTVYNENFLKHLPPYLFISFNRGNPATFRRISNKIRFQTEYTIGFDLTELVEDSPQNDKRPYVYDLLAVVRHIAASNRAVDCGHFNVAVRYRGMFYNVDDDFVGPPCPFGLEASSREAAYFLYRRR